MWVCWCLISNWAGNSMLEIHWKSMATFFLYTEWMRYTCRTVYVFSVCIVNSEFCWWSFASSTVFAKSAWFPAYYKWVISPSCQERERQFSMVPSSLKVRSPLDHKISFTLLTQQFVINTLSLSLSAVCIYECINILNYLFTSNIYLNRYHVLNLFTY